jgi:cellulose synthase/poly-beta-1,6-N-acetylglucosamine synthase-like glycosyltransferase
MGTMKVTNKCILAAFQNIEYNYNNLIRDCFSKVFSNSVWFFGTFSCYRKSAIKKVGYFKKDTLSEDVDMALLLYRQGFNNVHVAKAYHSTIVPSNLKDLFNQRARWSIGVLQSLIKNKSLFSLKSSPSILFLFINHFWWSFFAFVSLPAIIYQINYWLPSNLDSFSSLFMYLFRWFSLAGPIYVLYKIPLWGFNFYSFFGVFSGIISAFLIIASIILFKDKFSLSNLLALFFYFPYTIVLNIIMLLSLLVYSFQKKRFFIR